MHRPENTPGLPGAKMSIIFWFASLPGQLAPERS
jgi:hypothetical protein